MQRFELSDGKSHKFWQVEASGTELTVQYGRIGTDGQTKVKEFASAEQAEHERDKLIAQKTKKGYAPAKKSAAKKPAAKKPAAKKRAAQQGKATQGPSPKKSSPDKAAPQKATKSGVPDVLVNPPWLQTQKVAKRVPAVLDVQPLPHEESLVWEPGQREAKGWSPTPRAISDSQKQLQDFLANCKKHEDKGKTMDCHIDDWWHVSKMDAAEVFTAVQEAPLLVWRSYTAEYVLAQIGERALETDAFLKIAARFGQPSTTKILSPIVSTRVAPLMALGFVAKRSKAAAAAWLRAHPEVAAKGIIPWAVGVAGKERDAAEAALHHLVSKGFGDIVREVAAQYGDAVASEVEAILADDPALKGPKKLPKLPDYVDAAALPRVELRAGGTLSPDELEVFLTMLAFSPLDVPYAHIATVKNACTEETLGQLAAALFQLWLNRSQSSTNIWMFMAMGHIGTDDNARHITPFIRRWPGLSRHQVAVKGLSVLRAIGSDVAMMMLYGISQKVKFKGIKENARKMVDEIAEERGLSPAELGDRLVPTLDLDDDGSATLDFGSRTFRVGFDEALKPFVTDENNKRLANLPKVGKNDDAALGKAATERWKALKKDVRTLAHQQVQRLELAMCDRRRWRAEDFEAFLVHHPLVVHLTRRLVWGVYDQDGNLSDTFRVAEDRTYADGADDAYSLGPEVTVGLVHRLDLSEEDVTRWGEVFADYGLAQPFEQLARETHALEAPEKKAKSLNRHDQNKEVPVKAVRALLNRGWEKGPPQDAGWIWWLVRPLPGGQKAKLHVSPGLHAGGYNDDEDQKLEDLSLPVPAGDLDPALCSELIRDLNLVLQSASRRP